MKKRVLLIFAVLSSFMMKAQITPGGIAFLGIMTDAPDAFAFVTLQDIAAGDSIFITDNGWNGTAFFSNENTMRWKATSAVPAATVIYIQDPNDPNIPNALITGPGATTGKLGGLSASGEQLFAYVLGAGSAQIPIASISTNGYLAVCNTSGIGNGQTSCLPSTLTLGTNAVQLTTQAQGTGNPDNGFFNIPAVTGSVEEILGFINDPSNWTLNDDTAIAGISQWPAWSFTIGEAIPSVVNFSVSAISITEGGNPVSVNFTINPPLIVDKTVSIQFDVNGNVSAADFNTVPAHTAGLVQITIPAEAETFSFLVSAPAGDAVEGDEICLVSIASADNGIIIGPQNTVNMEIIEDLNASFISFAPGVNSYDGTEGQTITLELNISPALATESSFSLEYIPGIGVNAGENTFVPAETIGSINFVVPAGATSVDLPVTLTEDTEVEPIETFTLTLTNLTGNFNLGQQTQITVRTIDNDVPENLPNLFINELMSFNSTTLADEYAEVDDWIEIYNAGTTEVDLAGLFITDLPDQMPPVHQFESGSPATIVPAGGFRIVWADDSTWQGANHVGFTLPNTGGYVGLFQQIEGSAETFYYLIDEVTYPGLQLDETYGRTQDGGLPWIIFTQTTPGATNETVGLENTALNKLVAYPNPVSDQFNIRLTEISEKVRIRINDVNGKTVWTYDSNAPESVIQIPVQHWSNGLYLADVTQGNKRVVVKIQVAH